LSADGQPQFNIWKAGKYRFTNSVGQSKEMDVNLNPPINISHAWNILFEPATGAGEMELTAENLFPWNEHHDGKIKHFAGTATYRKSFELSSEQAKEPVRLHIENIHDIAQVWLNGRD